MRAQDAPHTNYVTSAAARPLNAVEELPIVFNFLPHPLDTIVPFAIVLGILVFIHEFGHYFAARCCGVQVDAFSIGFGRPIARWKDRVGTEWRLSILPLGGYVKLHGQERPEDVTADVRALWIPGKTFHEKGVGRRAIIIAAGPAANFILAAVIYAGIFATVGEPKPVAVVQPVVGDVQAGSAAARAGLERGDRILSIDGKPVATFEDVRKIIVGKPETRVSIAIARNAQDRTVSAVTDVQGFGASRIGLLGITALHTQDYRRLPAPRAVVAGIVQTWTVARDTLAGIWQIIAGRLGTEELGGPLRIAQLSGQVAQLGLLSLVSFIAILSVNLGLINLFPIPILDGGHLMFYLAEVVRGRPLPPRAVEYGLRAGLALIATLFVFVTWNDLTHFGFVRWVTGLIG